MFVVTCLLVKCIWMSINTLKRQLHFSKKMMKNSPHKSRRRRACPPFSTMMCRFLLGSALLACVTASTYTEYTTEALADQVTDLPGAENLKIPFNQFSGYLKVNGTKNLHYWLVESARDPANDPVAFWTN
ncbi:hypothetical protein B484DRAFT_415048, partial [Ochromonadaceae sp. CCMP2298]